MGCCDDAEICELVGLYLLHRLTHGKNADFEKEKIGLYRNDGLALMKINQSGRTAERSIKTKLISVLREENLNITVEPAS